MNQTEIMMSTVQNKLNESIEENKNLTREAKEVADLLDEAKKAIKTLQNEQSSYQK